MRILYFHQYFATRRRSTATRSYELARRLVERGHQVTIVSRDTRALEHDRTEAPRGRLVARETIDGIDVVFISMPYSNYFSTPLRVASFAGFTAAASLVGLGLPRPDVVFASSTPLTIGIPGLLVSRLKGVPFVFEIRDLWPAVPVALGALRGRPLIALAERLERLLYREARRVVVLSEGSRDALVGMGVPAGKLVFVPNASDLDLFRPDVREPGFRARHGLEGAFVALYSGAMGRANGRRSAPGRGRGAQAGAGSTRSALVAVGDGAEKPRLLRRAEAEGLDNVLFLPPVAKTALAGIVGAADVTLTLFAPYPVLQTNSPNKLFDSLAAGRPVDRQPRRLAAPGGRGGRGRRLRAGRRRRGAGGDAGGAGRRARSGSRDGRQRQAARRAGVRPGRHGRQAGRRRWKRRPAQRATGNRTPSRRATGHGGDRPTYPATRTPPCVRPAEESADA